MSPKPLVLTTVFVVLAAAVVPRARHAPSTASAFLLSEQIPLPPYADKELGRLEYPAIAVDSKKSLFIAYNYTIEEGREAVFLNSFNTAEVIGQPSGSDALSDSLMLKHPPKWRGATQISAESGVEYRPRISVTPNDEVWIVWAARRNTNWDIYARTLKNGEPGREQRITSGTAYDFRPAVLAARDGRIWLAWERGTPEKQIEIVAKSYHLGSWSEEMVVESRPGYAYRPALVEGESGEVWIAWDHAHGANTDIYIRRLDEGTASAAIRVTSHPAIDSKPALAWRDGKLWVAWSTNRRGTDGWGIIRYPLVRIFDGKKWFEPVSQPGGIDLESRAETQSFEYPTLHFDNTGRLYLLTRHDHAFAAHWYENDSWHGPVLLDTPSWGQRGLYVHTADAGDAGLWMARRDRETIHLQKLVGRNAQKSNAVLKEFTTPTWPSELKFESDTAYRGLAGEPGFKAYYGDLHLHTAYSDGSGSFDELFTLYKYVYKLDFIAITEHDALRRANNNLSPGEWAFLKSLNEIYNQPGEFVTLNGYEWTHSTWSGAQDSSVRTGHKNVYFRGGEEAPFFNHHGTVAYDAPSLFNTLRKHEGIAFPHHPAWGGMTWHDHDPGIQTNYEIVSIHGANEYMGNLPIPHRGGMPGTFVQDGLAQGKVFGLVGASDSHGLFWHANEGWRADPYKGGLTGVLLEGELTREAVWDALKNRRNYATSGEKYYLAFTIDGAPMGSQIEIDEPPTIAFEARSSELVYAYVIRNNETLFVTGKIGGDFTAYKGLADKTIPQGQNFYYLRVVYKDGTMAWSSPIWVTYTPKGD